MGIVPCSTIVRAQSTCLPLSLCPSQLELSTPKLDDADKWVAAIKQTIQVASPGGKRGRQMSVFVDKDQSADESDTSPSAAASRKPELSAIGELGGGSAGEESKSESKKGGGSPSRASSSTAASASSSLQPAKAPAPAPPPPPELAGVVQELIKDASPAVTAGSKWRLVELTNRLRVFEKTSGGGPPCIKVVGVVPLEADVVKDLVLDVSGPRSEWDPHFASGSSVEKKGNNTDVARMALRPVWAWPVWCHRRDLCLVRHWRKMADGTICIALKSTDHKSCAPRKDPVRAVVSYGGFVIVPRPSPATGDGAAAGGGAHSVVTMVLEIDPRGWLWSRGGYAAFYAKQLLLNLAGLRDYGEQRLVDQAMWGTSAAAGMKGAAVAAAGGDGTLPRGAGAGADDCGGIRGDRALGTAAAAAEVGSGAAASGAGGKGRASGGSQQPALTPLQEGRLRSRLPFRDPDDEDLTHCWTLPDVTTFKVRGPDYCDGDKRKIASKSAALPLLAVDLVQSPGIVTDVGSRPSSLPQKMKDSGLFFLVLNWLIPNDLNFVAYFEVPKERPDHWSDNFAELLRRFLSEEEDDSFRTCRFKLIPRIVKGSWVVKKGVGSKPAIVGNKLTQTYSRGDNYFEIDVDVNSTSVGVGIFKLVAGYVKNLILDLNFVIQGNGADELPEHILGGARLSHIDLDMLNNLDEDVYDGGNVAADGEDDADDTDEEV